MPIDKGREGNDRPPNDWERIELERAQRDRVQRQWDREHDPSPEWEAAAQPLPPDYGLDRPRHREIPPEVAEMFGRTPEQIQALREKMFTELEARRDRLTADQPEEPDHSGEPAGDQTENGPGTSVEAPSTFETEGADRTPAEYRPELAARLPEWTRGARTEGILVRADNAESLWGDRVVQSGYDGPAKLYHPRELGLRHGWWNLSHVETHAAATLRSTEDEPDTADVVLYINKEPCKGPKGCDANLETMLPEGRQLTVFWPGGSRVYIGQPDEPQAH